MKMLGNLRRRWATVTYAYWMDKRKVKRQEQRQWQKDSKRYLVKN